MSCSLIGLYIMFVICGQVTAIPPLCGISSGLLHYFLLAFFAWTSVEAIWLYLKLVKIFGLQSIESRFLMISSLLSWCVPLLIVATSAAGYRYFTSDYYCRAREWPFWMGLFLPLVLMYIFNWIMFAVIVMSVCKHISSSSKHTRLDASKEKPFGGFSIQNFIITVVLSITLGLGWGCGFFATSHDVLPIVIIFQGTFTVVVGIHGVLLFILHGIRNPDARALWKSMLFFVIPRKTSSLESTSAINMKSTKQASVSNPLSTDLGLSHSMTCEKDCSTAEKIDLVPAMGIETNNGIPSHTINEESEEIVALDSLIQKAEIWDLPIQGQEGFVAVMVKKLEQYFA